MSQAATVYGQALYALAQEENLAQPLLSQLEQLAQIFSDQPRYALVLSSHGLSKQERCALLDESVGQAVHPYVLNFLKILVEKGHIRLFSQCCEAYRQCYYRDNGILPVTAVTARLLSPAQSQRLTEKLAAITGKSILLTNRVDEDLLGGIRLDYDGKQLEDSISHRLEEVRQLLKNTVL